MNVINFIKYKLRVGPKLRNFYLLLFKTSYIFNHLSINLQRHNLCHISQFESKYLGPKSTPNWDIDEGAGHFQKKLYVYKIRYFFNIRIPTSQKCRHDNRIANITVANT